MMAQGVNIERKLLFIEVVDVFRAEILRVIKQDLMAASQSLCLKANQESPT